MYALPGLPGSLLCSWLQSDQTPQNNLAVVRPEIRNFRVQYPAKSPVLPSPLTMSPRGSTVTAEDTFLQDIPQTSSTQTLDDPSPFLLDDDPFANLTSSVVVSTLSSCKSPLFQFTPQAIDSTLANTSLAAPRSPLSPPDSSTSCYFGPVLTPPPRARSLGKIKPAYARPAFGSRPSLPSLDTLARTNIEPPRKVRKGRVGAQLPFEPWENQQDAEESGMSGNELEKPCITRPPSPPMLLAQFRAQYVAGSVTKSTSADDFEFDAHAQSFTLTSNSEPSLQFMSDGDLFSFFDNLSTPSLERSSAPLSRSLSIESMSPSDPGLGGNDRSRDNFGIPISDFTPDGCSDTPTGPLPPWCSLSRKGSSARHSDNFLHAGDSLNPVLSATELVLQDILVEPFPESTSDSLGQEQSMSSGTAPSKGYTESPQFGPRGDDGSHNENNGQSGFNGHPPRGNDGNWGGGRGRDEGSDDERRGRSTLRPSLSGSSTSSTSSSEEDSEDDYSESISQYQSKFIDGVSSEDDVPLAQRIPTALQAQHTIRKQFREARDRRRRERAVKQKAEQTKTNTNPASSNNVTHSLALSSSQEAALRALKQNQPKRPSTADSATPRPRPFAPEELARKLQDVQVADFSPSGHFRSRSTSRVVSRDEATRGRTIRTVDVPPPIPLHQPPGRATSASEAGSRTLRTMRSFHHTHSKNDDIQPGFSLTDVASNFARRATARARSRVREEPPLPPPSAWQPPPLPGSSQLPQPRSSGETPRKLVKSQPTSTKTSGELERPLKSTVLSPSSNIKTQQRIFVGDLQKFHTVEVDNYTSADDVLSAVRSQGSLSGTTGHGGWMLFEVAQDFGMERPIRGYELLSDIQASWNKDKLVNMFIIKMTALAIPLSREAIPSSSPIHGSYVEWEMKRGKWTKRWLRLREHSLWLSKRDIGKEEVFLCSLSNFDAYFMTRVYKSPKPFVFAVKSTENLSLFENTADYMHIFSCQPHDGQKWIEKILIARSYVLYQERNILFSSKTPSGNGGPPSRVETRKVMRPSRPLVNIPPSYPGSMQQVSSSTHADVFEPGSLLAKN